MQLSNLSGNTIAIMVASGFDEAVFIAIQRAMMSVNAKLRVVSRDAGLTNAWNGTGWGMSYPVDATLSTTLAVDYDALIIPAGERHVATLTGEAHAKRLLRAFTREGMPVLALNEGTQILELVDVTLTAPAAGEAVVVDGKIAVATKDDLAAGLIALDTAMTKDDGESVAA
ncbi:MAG: peptidase, family C56 [Bacteroidetes bacterium]|nr:peptidase, family C56 [Bacteroidota bacterium]